MSYEKLKVHSKIVGKGKKNSIYINDFLVKKPSKVVKKAFRLQQLIWFSKIIFLNCQYKKIIEIIYA